MNDISTSRTSPTIKSMSVTNRKSLGNWEIRIGLWQSVLLTGLVLGSLACTFYLGFFSGRRVGFENALAGNLASFPKFPVAENAISDSELGSDRAASDMYAKLGDDELDLKLDSPAKPLPELEKKEMPAHVQQPTQIEKTSPLSAAIMNTKDSHDPKIIRTLDDVAKTALLNETMDAKAPSAHAEPLGALIQQETKENKDAKEKVKVEEKVSPVVKKEMSAAKKSKPQVLALANNVELKKETVKQIIKNNKSTTQPIKRVIPPGWFAQVGAPRKLQDAEALSAKLKRSGFPVAIENADVRGQQYFRVLVGPERTRETGGRLLEQLKREHYLEGEPFLRMIK